MIQHDGYAVHNRDRQTALDWVYDLAEWVSDSMAPGKEDRRNQQRVIPMTHEQHAQSPEEFFPAVESFTDFAGKRRSFVITLLDLPMGYFVRAHERGREHGKGGYRFASYSPVDPFAALGLLRHKIRRGLATRYLVSEQGRRSLSHDRLKGTIDDGGVVVDGAFITFDELCYMLQTYEGFQISLTIADLYDEV